MRGVISKIFFKKSLLWDIYQKQRTKCISNISILFLYNFFFFFFFCIQSLKLVSYPLKRVTTKDVKQTHTHILINTCRDKFASVSNKKQVKALVLMVKLTL